jgi:conjugative relaxase-like TrwC/TraI family protein
MISIRRVSLGAGFRYLMESVAKGDGAPGRSNDLTRYYSESATPPGVFVGAGLAGLAEGKGVEKGTTVSEEHLYRMLGLCADPITGTPLGRPPNNPTPRSNVRPVSRGASLSGEDGGPLVLSTASDGSAPRAVRTPVAGFDLTFSPSKSVSTAWAVADDTTKAVIYDCHRRAIDYVLGYAEREVLHSRSGRHGIVQEDVKGVVAAAFTHWDSRAGDPQLHDHVVVLNRAQSTSDSQWRTLDSRGLFKQTVALSELHHGVLSDLLTEALGWGWDGRQRRHSAAARWEVTGVADTLIGEFSQRADAIESRSDTLIADFTAAHGRRPTGPEVLRLRQQATLETRPDKTHRSLNGMTWAWRERAIAILNEDPVAWVSTLRDRNDLPLLRAGDLDDAILLDAANLAARTVASRRATFTQANILAEVFRQLHGVRFASPDDRLAVAERTTALALRSALMVTAPDLHHTPRLFQRSDGTSRFRSADQIVYTTRSLLDAEARLLDAGRRVTAPTVSAVTIAWVTDTDLPGRDYAMSTDQAVAVEGIATSGRVVDVLVGPAGTGKSTTMAGLRAVWEAQHGAGSVVGLAPSAAAAAVLADELGIDTENLSKWLHEHRQTTRRLGVARQLEDQLYGGRRGRGEPAGVRQQLKRVQGELGRWQPQRGQLVIVDEASLAGTFALDELVAATARVGAKVLLVGDWAQLSGVEAGGMFRALVADRDGLAPELVDVRRFRQPWEKTASVQLRAGHPDAVDTYDLHGRIVDGNRDDMLNALYEAWKTDVDAGLTSLMIAPDTATVADLNARAHQDRLAAGDVAAEGLTVAAGQTAGVGDLVITRQNDRQLTVGRGWVKNGDCWTVTATNPDGSMTLRRLSGFGRVVLPAAYVTDHVELGYATTAYRAQGRTVDSAHTLISPTTTKEALYVAATRGRDSNRLYVDTHWDPDPHTAHDGATEVPTAKEVLVGVLGNEGADLAAHEMIRRAQAEAESIRRLAAEYQTIATAAQAARWEHLLDRCGLTADQHSNLRASPAHGPLLVALRNAEAVGLDVDTAFPALVTGRSLVGVDDVATVLHGRVDRWVDAAGSRRALQADLIVGLIPRAQHVTDPDMQQALREREEAIEQHTLTLIDDATQTGQPWLRHLGTPPADPARRLSWLREVCTVAAYRDRWNITTLTVIGRQADATSVEQLGQRKRAQAAIDRAAALARTIEHAAANTDLSSIITVENAIRL